MLVITRSSLVLRFGHRHTPVAHWFSAARWGRRTGGQNNMPLGKQITNNYGWWIILIPVLSLGLTGCWDFEEKGWSNWNSSEPTLQSAEDAMRNDHGL